MLRTDDVGEAVGVGMVVANVAGVRVAVGNAAGVGTIMVGFSIASVAAVGIC